MALTQVQDGMLGYDGGSFANRNRIINGDMRIDQRNAGASVANPNPNYITDRFAVAQYISTTTAQQSATAPSGYSNSLLVTNGTATAPAASSYTYRVVQNIEGFNSADLAFGTASAKTITLSFWVRSSLTGTFAVAFQNSAQNRAYVSTYTINAANTFEQKTITITGDTSGTWIGATNGIGLRLFFDLGSGTDSNTTANAWQTGNYSKTSDCVAFNNNTSATFYITGVQLEEGSVATPFERRLYGQELALCQRYYETTSYPNATQNITSTQTSIIWASSYATGQKYLVVKRAAPTITIYGRGGVAGSPTRTDTGEAITGTSTANNIGAVGYWGVAMGQGLAAYSTYALEVGYAASAEL